MGDDEDYLAELSEEEWLEQQGYSAVRSTSLFPLSAVAIAILILYYY